MSSHSRATSHSRGSVEDRTHTHSHTSNAATEGSVAESLDDSSADESMIEYLQHLDKSLTGTPQAEGSAEVNAEGLSTETKRKRKHHRRSSQGSTPLLNTWDVPEFMPGAQPGASAVDKALFEERSVKVFQNDLVLDKIEDEASQARAVNEMVERLENDLSVLQHMFPTLDLELIQDSYLNLNSNLDATITELLELANHGEQQNINGRNNGPPESTDIGAFPVLKDADGWEILGIASSSKDGSQTDDNPPAAYKQKLLSKKEESTSV